MPYVHVPILRSIPVLGPILSGQNLIVYPDAAATAGIDVRKTRYAALVLSGLLAGLGGVQMSMGYLQLFQRDMTAVQRQRRLQLRHANE